MGTILDYLKEYGDYSLEEKPFGDVDSLVISQLSYLKFDGIVPAPEEERAPISIREIAAHEDYDRIYGDERYRKDNTALFTGILNSRRFGELRLWNYVNLIEPEKESQFSAVVCGMTGGLCGLSGYRCLLRGLEGGFKSGLFRAGARTALQRALSGAGGADDRRRFLCGRPLQRGELCGLCSYALQRAYESADRENL